jgi:hypothetical protein
MLDDVVNRESVLFSNLRLFVAQAGNVPIPDICIYVDYPMFFSDDFGEFRTPYSVV